VTPARLSVAFAVLSFIACAADGPGTSSGGAVDPTRPGSGNHGDIRSDGTAGQDGGTTPGPGPTPIADGGSPDADASPASFCQRQGAAPFLCSDFEGGGLPGAWSRTSMAGEGNVSLVADPVRSSKVSAMVLGAAGSGACLERTIGSGRTFVRVEADLRLVKGGADRYDFFELTGGNADEVSVELDQSGATYWDFQIDSVDSTFAMGRTQSAEWTRLRLDITKNGNGAVARFYAGGVLVSERSAAADAFSGTSSFALGDCTANLASSWEVRFDDVVVEVQ